MESVISPFVFFFVESKFQSRDVAADNLSLSLDGSAVQQNPTSVQSSTNCSAALATLFPGSADLVRSSNVHRSNDLLGFELGQLLRDAFQLRCSQLSKHVGQILDLGSHGR